MTELGFKKLTLENWLQPDPILAAFVRSSFDDGQVHSMEGEDWVRIILQPHLAETVPAEVQRLFEVARSALAYGYFFYPLYTLAGEQLFRVAEAAVTHKCKAMKAPSSRMESFQKMEDYLIEQNIIPAQDKDSWDAIRHLRNSTSHPKQQDIFLPTMAFAALKDIANRINSLFPK